MEGKHTTCIVKPSVIVKKKNLSRKLLFVMLNRNDPVIKIFLALYLVSLYVEYMYICVYMCIMNLHIPKVRVYLILCWD